LQEIQDSKILKDMITFLYRIRLTGLIFCAGILLMSCDDEWKSHYNRDQSLTSNATLWDSISSNPNLSEFAAVLKQAGYDKILSSSQTYTVWAPKNGTFSVNGMSEDRIIKEFVNNHIARSSFSASGEVNRLIHMLNGKVLTFNFQSGKYLFQNIEVNQESRLCKNGILYRIQGTANYLSNIWEYLDHGTKLDSLRNFLYSFNQITFDPDLSTVGGVNEHGDIFYIDSVFTNSNILLRRLGSLNSEDSTYTFIAPTNSAWREAYNRIKNYFVYDNQEPKRDSLQGYNTRLAMVNDLAFSNTIQLSPNDSMTSTTKNVFKNPSYLFDGAQQVPMSNGKMYITDKLKHPATLSWYKTIVTEAESTTGRDQAFCTIYTRSSSGSSITGISGNRYVEALPTGTNSSPTITFSISRTLSAKYNVYCLFVPATVANANSTDTLPGKVYFNLAYKQNTGFFTQVSSPVFYPRSTKLEKVLVFSGFSFPAANYGQEETNVTLKVICNVARNETTKYTRTLRVDCIVLEPVQ
jgi:uncharacterized surface protein with fasciclin (FAS1) repeats